MAIDTLLVRECREKINERLKIWTQVFEVYDFRLNIWNVSSIRTPTYLEINLTTSQTIEVPVAHKR